MNQFSQQYPKVGIIGGAGPMAGVLLFQKIVQICQETYNCQEDHDFPYMLLLNYPFSDMLKQVDDRKRAVIKEQLRECFSTFRKNEISIATIACNTLHEFLEPTETNDFNLIHMIKLIASKIKDAQLKKTIVIGSTTSTECKLHQKYFDCVYINTKKQPEIQQLIDIVLAGKQKKEHSQQLASLLNDEITHSNFPSGEKVGLVLGCTEFSVLNEQFPLRFNELNPHFYLLDPNSLVAERICQLIFS